MGHGSAAKKRGRQRRVLVAGVVLWFAIASAAETAKLTLVPGEELYLFTVARPVWFTVQSAPQPLTWKVLDVDRGAVREGALTVPAGQAEARLELAPLPLGYYELEAGGKSVSARCSFVLCPADREYRNPCFGLNVTHLTHLTREGFDPALRVLRGTRRLGFAWVRCLFTWEDVNPQANVWAWGVADAFVAESERLKLEMLPGLFYTPSWASTASPTLGRQCVTFMPRPEAFSTFCETVAKRYAGRINWWETWNEPDAELFWKGRPTSTTTDAILTDLVELSRLAYEGVRRGNPGGQARRFRGYRSGF